MLAPGHLLQLAYFGFEVLDVAEKERFVEDCFVGFCHQDFLHLTLHLMKKS